MDTQQNKPLAKPKFREVVFLLMYISEFGVENEGDSKQLQFVSDELKVAMRHMREASILAEKVSEKVDELDQKIAAASTEYEIGRIPKVEITLLRLALYEIFHGEEISHKVVISEAIRLAKKFGNGESHRFVNAILDAIYQQSLAPASV